MYVLLKYFLILTFVTLNSLAQDWQPAGNKIKTRWAKDVTPTNAWREYPRPQMVRSQWQNLNGLWSYKVRNRPKPKQTLPQPTAWDGKILVPFCIESSLSGVGKILAPYQELWYERSVDIKKGNDRILLHFEAVDYLTEVWINGKNVGTHKGGNNPFKFDISAAATEGTNKILVKVIDETAHYQLLGKQRRRPGGIFYTRVSGIWQTVWLENVPQTFIDRIKIDTSINPGTITVKTFVGGDKSKATAVKITASFKGEKVLTQTGTLEQTTLTIKDAKLWAVGAPNLYDLKIELLGGDSALDSVDSYAGIRTVGKIKDKNGHMRFTLNDKVVFHLGPLDQGWWPDGLLTPPSDTAMRYDIDYIKAAGFNMIRNHIKVRPRRYYTYCDQQGIMIWQDQVSSIPNPHWTRFKENPQDKEWPDHAHEQFIVEYKEMVDMLYNSPSIVSWVPFNEAWGQHRTMEVGKKTGDYDKTRLLNIASGGNFWPIGDIADNHSYPHPKFPFADKRLTDYIKVVGEFGGHGIVVDDKHLWNIKARKWSYGGLPKSMAELHARYEKSMSILLQLKKQGVAGAVYTQTSDVEDEINGLITYDREVIKFPAAKLKSIHEKLYTPSQAGKE